MLRRIIKIIVVLAVVVPLAALAAIPFIGDEAFYGALVATPVIGDYADAILNRKQRIEATLSRYGADWAEFWASLAGDRRGGGDWHTPRVEVALPPAPATGAADQGWTVRTEPQGAPPGEKHGHRQTKPASLKPEPLVITPPPPPLVGEPEPAPEPAAKAAAKPHAKPPAQAAAREEPAPIPPPKPKPTPPTKVTMPAARVAQATPPKKPTRPDESADLDHKRGMLFYKGIGVEKDFKKAAMWFRRAAEKGHAVAQYNLGIMCYLGQGVPQDYAQAAMWFRRAAEQDHAAAQYNLGFLYYEGKGVEKDDLQAYMWIDRAANLGDEKAIKARDTLQKALPKDIFKQ